MSKVDDELTRRLQRAERPVSADQLFEGLERRRSHRERVRRVQAGLLAFAVLAGTAAGFSILTGLFDPDRRGTVAISPYGAGGAIVTCGDEAGGQICRIDAGALARGATTEDLIRLTEFSGVQVTAPAVSPDGTTVVFERHDPPETSRSETAELWTIGTDGTGLRRLSARGSGFTEASWGPTGLLVAVASDGDPDDAALAILDPSAGPSARVATIELPGLSLSSSPRWSPDNERILFGATAEQVTDLYTVAIDGSDLRNVTSSPETEYSPTWSPDGRSIAFWVGSPNGVEIRICPVDCSAPRPVSDPEGQPIYGDSPVWSPDGEWIAFLVDSGRTTDVHIARVDGSEVRTLATALGQIAWIPLMVGSTPSPPEPEPSPTPSAGPAGRDIGLGFNLCHLEWLGGVDFLGDGTRGQAWTGAKVKENGTCPAPSLGNSYLVAADIDGDGVADAASETVVHCFFCRPFDVVDFDADGDDELVVMASEGSTPTFMVYDLRDTNGALRIEPVLVAAPGHRAGRHEPDQPLTFSTGGDEGYAGWVRCESFPAAPELVVTWRDHPIEGDTMEVHETRFVLEADGLFHVVGTIDYSAPVADAIPGVSDAPACGVDWQMMG
jgi:Tol biopolymer transport system component